MSHLTQLEDFWVSEHCMSDGSSAKDVWYRQTTTNLRMNALPNWQRSWVASRHWILFISKETQCKQQTEQRIVTRSIWLCHRWSRLMPRKWRWIFICVYWHIERVLYLYIYLQIYQVERESKAWPFYIMYNEKIREKTIIRYQSLFLVVWWELFAGEWCGILYIHVCQYHHDHHHEHRLTICMPSRSFCRSSSLSLNTSAGRKKR